MVCVHHLYLRLATQGKRCLESNECPAVNNLKLRKHEVIGELSSQWFIVSLIGFHDVESMCNYVWPRSFVNVFIVHLIPRSPNIAITHPPLRTPPR